MATSAAKRLFVALPTVLALTACGVDRAADEPPSPRTTTSSEPATTTTTTTTTTAVPFVAADARNLAACTDGVCEVFVQTGDSLPSAAGPVQVTVDGGMVTIAQVDSTGFASNMTGAPGSTQQINNQVFDIIAVQNGQGLLRLTLG